MLMTIKDALLRSSRPWDSCCGNKTNASYSRHQHLNCKNLALFQEEDIGVSRGRKQVETKKHHKPTLQDNRL